MNTLNQRDPLVEGFPQSAAGCAFEYAPAGLLFLDARLNVRAINESAKQMLLIDESFKLDVGIAKVLGDATATRLTKVLHGDAADEFELYDADLPRRFHRKTVGAKHFLLKSQVAHDAVNKLLGIAVEIEDITKRKSAEHSANMRMEQLLVAIGLAPPILWIANAQGELVQMDLRWQALTGLSREEALAQGWTHVLHPDDRPLAILAWWSARSFVPLDELV